MSRAEICETCDFWQVEPRDLSIGTCRRHPPKIIGQSPAGLLSGFPTSNRQAWCGDWKESRDAVKNSN